MTSSSLRSVRHLHICGKASPLTSHTATLEQTHLKPNRILAPHTRYYIREMRILAYNQLLESYRSLTLESLARSFGMSIDFVDKYVLPDISAVYGCAKTALLQRAVAIYRIRPPSLYNRQGEWRRGDEPTLTQERAVRDCRPPRRYTPKRGAEAEQSVVLTYRTRTNLPLLYCRRLLDRWIG